MAARDPLGKVGDLGSACESAQSAGRHHLRYPEFIMRRPRAIERVLGRGILLLRQAKVWLQGAMTVSSDTQRDVSCCVAMVARSGEGRL